MNERPPPLDVFDWFRHVLPWGVTLLVSAFAAMAQYAAKVRKGESFSWRSLLLDAVVCMFAGMLMHLVCEWQGIGGPARSVLVAVTAHMGTRAMMQFEAMRDRVLGGVK